MELETNIGYALTEIPEMPESLSEAARQHWNDLIPIIVDLKTARPADTPALIILCEALADLNQMQASIRQDGFTSKTASGVVKGHPALRGLEACRTKVEYLMGRFGLMPLQYKVPDYSDYLRQVERRKQREAEGDEYDYE